MARQIINVGTAGNDGTGDDLRTGGNKINANFQDLYSQLTAVSLSLNQAQTNSNGIGFGFNGILFDGATKDSFTTVTRLVPADPTQINIQQMQDSSGDIALVADIKRLVNQSYILGIRGGQLLDSAAAIDAMFKNGFLDSSRAVRISLDSADITGVIDSDYVRARQAAGLDSAAALAFLKTENDLDSHFADNIASRDSDITKLKADVLATSTAFTDDIQENPGGAINLYYTTARHDSDTLVLVDSAYVNARVQDAPNALDSAEGQAMIESNFGAINRDLVPMLDSVYDLGSSTKKWKDLHLSGNTIFLGGGTISFDNNQYTFGNGSLKSEQAISMDSGQRLFFANGGANITHSVNPQVNSLMMSANTLTLRTVDDVKPGWYIKSNSPAGGAFSRLGDAGLVFVPHNTNTNRTQFSTNAFYSDDYRKGAIHYSTTDNRVEMSDSDGWFPVHRNNAAVTYMTFGRDPSTANATNTDLFATDGVLQGYVMPVPGTITHVTARTTASNYSSGSSTFLLDIDVNGITQASRSVEVTSNGTIILNDTLNVTYVAGDTLSVALTQDAGHTATNTVAVLRIQED